MYDAIIIGAGPAGLTAALYLGRARLKTRMLEKCSVGGQVLLTDIIENYPGIPQMKSSEWVRSLTGQISALSDVEISQETKVEKVENTGKSFKVHIISEATGSKEILESRCVIVATGARPRRLGIKGEEALTGRGVSYCATCDGPLFKGKEVVLVGGGDTAIEEALYLRKFARKMTIVHRRNALRATAVLQERVKADDKITIRWNSVPTEIVGKTRVEAIKLKSTENQKEEVLACDGVFVFIGSDPDTAFLKGLIELNSGGFAISDENMASSCRGIFVAGDCRARPFNQIVTACSEGAIASFSVVKFLENKQ